jgi:hypothetical protein
MNVIIDYSSNEKNYYQRDNNVIFKDSEICKLRCPNPTYSNSLRKLVDIIANVNNFTNIEYVLYAYIMFNLIDAKDKQVFTFSVSDIEVLTTKNFTSKSRLYVGIRGLISKGIIRKKINTKNSYIIYDNYNLAKIMTNKDSIKLIAIEL